MAKKVVVAMSGGVDSSVAAALLQEQGFAVEGMFMKNWSPDTIQSLTDCPWEQDLADAEAVCKQLEIPFRSVNFEKEYREKVVDYFLREYKAGRTPNPDIMCNKEIKFAAFLAEAKKMGADYIATGHYARVEGDEIRSLYRGVDVSKDQSYFLHTLSSAQLGQVLLPLGGLLKHEVRQKAEELELPTANKKDSQGICFIGHIDLKKFLLEELGSKEGSVYLLPDYTENSSLSERKQKALLVGKHRGVILYTIGERARSCIDNRLYRILTGEVDVKPCYVLAREAKKNSIFVSRQHDDPHLYGTKFIIEGFTSPSDLDISTIEVMAREGKLTSQIRYMEKPVMVREVSLLDGKLLVVTEKHWAPAPGQSLVLFENERVIGGGVICDI